MMAPRENAPRRHFHFQNSQALRAAPGKISFLRTTTLRAHHSTAAPTVMSALLAAARAASRRVVSHHRRDATLSRTMRRMSTYPPHMVRLGATIFKQPDARAERRPN